MEEQQTRNVDTNPQGLAEVPPVPELNGSRVASDMTPPIITTSSAPGEFSEADARLVAIEALRAKMSSSVGVMNAVMAFSVLNAALISFGSPIVMAFGLATTDVISSLAKDSKNYVHLLWNLIPLGYYFLLSHLAKKSWGWLIFLMVCYAIDGVLAILGELWISTAIHVYALYLLWQGLSAAFAARKLERMPTDYIG
jgi:hypothetical protein